MNVKKFIEIFYPNYEEGKNAFVNRLPTSDEPLTKIRKKYREDIFDNSEEVFMKSLENFKKQICEKQREECMYAAQLNEYREIAGWSIIEANEPGIDELIEHFKDK